MFPKIQPMATPKTRSEFENRFHHMHQLFKGDRMHIASHIADAMSESILAVRRLPNGRLDFLSVDQTARLQANTTFQMPCFEDIPQNADDSSTMEKD